MSMKLRASLEDNYRSKMEQSYLRKEEVITLKKVPCEMKFQAVSGWIEHEGEDHHYLPLFHLNGFIKEIRGNFPYNVSSLNFADEDVSKHLQQDILYYMSPEEMVHMIQVGKFYTKDFELPGILTGSEYDFPVLVDLTIVPPPNPVAYEQASYGLDMQDANKDGVDRTNLPLFYVSFQGTGIDKKKDKLLEAYGIEFDKDYPMYTLTAESSGYTKPTLMEYITTPIVEKEAQDQYEDDLYLTPEEEAQMLRAREEQTQATQEPMYHPEEDYQLTEEDVLLTQADRNVEKRIAERMRTLNKEYDGVGKDRSMQQEAEQQAQREAEQEAQKQQTMQREPLAFDALESFMKPAKEVEPKEPVAQSAVQTEAIPSVVEEPVSEEPAYVAESERTVSVDPVEEVPVEENMVQAEQEGVDEKDAPDAQESYKHIEAVVKNESDALTRANGDKEEPKQDTAGLEVDEDEFSKLRDAQGADVADASLQAKVDEANVKENARQVAVDMQADMHQVDARPSQKANAEQATKSRREVGSVFENMVEKADAQRELREGDMGE